MKFLESVKRAFGFSSEGYIDDDIEDEVNDDSAIKTPYINPFKSEQPVKIKQITPEKNIEVAEAKTSAAGTFSSDNIPDNILQRIVDILNANLPDYIKNCLDTEAQKRFLADTLKDSFIAFSDEMKQQASEHERAEWENRLAEAKNSSAQMSEKMSDAENKLADMTSKFSLSETQRRTYYEKAQLLEAKVAASEAEIEQYELENKSLVNKLKVVQVKTDDVDYFKNENTRLLAEINKLKAQFAASTKDSELAKDIKDSLAVALADKESLSKTIESLNAQIEILNAQQLQSESSVKNELDTTMTLVNSLRNKLSENEHFISTLQVKVGTIDTENKNLEEAIKAEKAEKAEMQAKLNDAVAQKDLISVQKEELQNKVDKLQVEVSTTSQSGNNSIEIDTLKEKLRLSNEQIESLQEELNEANTGLEVIEKVQEQLDQVEEMKQKKDAKIADLKNLLHSRDTDIANLQSYIESLKLTIDNNNKDYSNKLKEISSMYEKQIIEESTKAANAAKQKDADSFDLISMDNDVASIMSIPQETVKSEQEEEVKKPVKEKEIAFVNENSNNSNVPDEPHISAVDHAVDDWLLPSPPTPNVQEVHEPSQPTEPHAKSEKNEEEEDSLQMSLF